MSAPTPVDFCGCCGNRCGADALWCKRCASHVLANTHERPLWECTWYAQKKEPCPFAVDLGGYGLACPVENCGKPKGAREDVCSDCMAIWRDALAAICGADEKTGDEGPVRG